jgi:hypothetical protein
MEKEKSGKLEKSTEKKGMNRRTFLQVTGAALGAAAVGPLTASHAAKNPTAAKDMINVASYTRGLVGPKVAGGP